MTPPAGCDDIHGCAPEVAEAWRLAHSRQAEQHVYALALSTYLHDLAAAEEVFAHTLAKLADALLRALPAANKAAGLAPDAPDAGCTTRGAIRALAGHGHSFSASLAEHSKLLRAEGLQLHRTDVEANRRGRAAQAHAATLAADVRAAQVVVDSARTTHLEMLAIAQNARTSEPPPKDPWLAEVALHAATDHAEQLAAAQDRGMRRVLSETVAADVVLTDAVGSLLADSASAQRRLHEGLMDRSAELVAKVKSIDGAIDLQRCVARHLPEGSGGAALLRAPAASSVPPSPGGKAAPAKPANGTEQAHAQAPHSHQQQQLPPTQRNLAHVEKLGLLSRQQTGLLAGLDLFGGWVDSLGVVTRNGWLHLFSAPDASEPHDSLCLLARPRSEESAATARPVPGQPGVFEVAKSMASGGYLFRSQHVVRWVLRAESAAAAAEWLALICAHTQLSRPPGSLAARACSVSEASVNGQPQPQPQPHVHREERGSEGEPATPRAHAKHPVGVVELDEEDAG